MIITLIQAIYDPKIPLPLDMEFYKQAMGDIEHFNIAPQVFFLLKQSDRLNQTPLFFQEELKERYRKTLYQNLIMKNQMEHILRKFEQLELSVIPLKGVLFSEKYFGHIGARPTSDIDLLIKAQDIDKAVDSLKTLGFVIEAELIPSHFHYSFSKKIPNSHIPLTVELHWDLLRENSSKLNIKEFWDLAQPIKNYEYVKELSNYHTFYMICLHGWRHHLNSLKYFLDIIQILHVLQGELDFHHLFHNASSHQTWRRVRRTLAIVYSQFPHLENIQPFPFKKSNLWWEYLSIRDSQYRSLKQYVNLFLFDLFDFDTPKHSWHAIQNWLLPSRVELGFELGTVDLDKKQSLFGDYLKLYRKRCRGLVHTILKLN